MANLIAAYRRARPLVWLWGRLARPMTLGVRIMIEDSEGRIALVRHSYLEGWHLPGGGVEPGETVQDSARREAQEEAGCDPGGLELLGIYDNRRVFRGDHVVLYRARDWAPCEPKHGMEIEEVRWVPVDEARRIGSPATRRRLAEILDGAPQAAEW